MLTARRLALTALERLGTVLVDDVAAPPPLLPGMLRRIGAIADEPRTTVGTVAHAGDGDLHPIVVFDRRDAAAEARAVAAFAAVMAQALDLGVTITWRPGDSSAHRPGASPLVDVSVIPPLLVRASPHLALSASSRLMLSRSDTAPETHVRAAFMAIGDDRRRSLAPCIEPPLS
ncbi:FAD-linked oxidase C-terminal domain-containing protein [Sorangium sp. So ce542]|uniref:FAD-linked oxidase C-terminal domain-containing protein n=1 Tax=Sorangium sp. So ce542 TaxID=3133316 RepID=UPI003F647C01